MKISRTVQHLALTTGNITKADILLIGGIVVISLLILAAAKFASPTGSVLEIRVGGKVYIKQDLTRDAIIEVKGPLGTTVVQIADQQARILSSPCRDKICVHMGPIEARGGVLICVPNEVSAHIVSDKKEGFDALTR